MTIEELDAELERARAHLAWLKAESIVEFSAMADEERNPYAKEFLLASVERFRAMGS